MANPAFTPADWYWRRSTDRKLFSSARIALVDDGDADFQAWLARGGLVTPWPRDLAGQETFAELQATLDRWGLFASLEAYAAARRYAVETGGIIVAGMMIATDDRSKTMILGLRISADSDATFTTPWASGASTITLDAPTIIAISNAVLAHVQACFTVFATVVAAIAANTITSVSDVDAAFAAVQP